MGFDRILREGFLESSAVLRNLSDHAANLIEYNGKDRRSSGEAIRVVVFPGYLQFGTAPFRYIESRFRQQDTVDVWGARTYFWGDLENTAREVAESLDGIYDGFFGHSMGGLLAEGVAKLPEMRGRVKTLVYLATPHRGTDRASTVLSYLPSMGRLSPSLRQMLPGSRFLRSLKAKKYPEGVRVVNIYGGRDRIVHPRRASLRGADQDIEIPDLGHWSILYDERVVQIIRENIFR